MQLLIKAGADVNHISNNGGSVMHYAAHKASDKIANMLIASGVKNVSAQDNTGKTPLYYAKLEGDFISSFVKDKQFQYVFFHVLLLRRIQEIQNSNKLS